MFGFLSCSCIHFEKCANYPLWVTKHKSQTSFPATSFLPSALTVLRAEDWQHTNSLAKGLLFPLSLSLSLSFFFFLREALLVILFRCLLVSTYLCERINSKVKYVKSSYRSSVSDMVLKSILMIVNTKHELQLDKLLLGKHHYHSCH
jgi:hypothetical protein